MSVVEMEEIVIGLLPMGPRKDRIYEAIEVDDLFASSFNCI